MSPQIYVSSINSSILPVKLNDSTYGLYINQPTHSSWSFKAGRLFGKTKEVFKKTETKVAAILSYWAVETLFFGIIILTATSVITFILASFLYFYGTYALFSAINALTK